MKKIILVIIFSGCTLTLYSQDTDKSNEIGISKKHNITVGILQGGGSLVGADFEILLTDQFGVQFGAGLVGYGAGLNFHLKPSIKSSFLSLQYWHQGVGDAFVQSVAGPTYVFRGKKWFTFQIGLGMPTAKGPAFPEDQVLPPVMLLYSVGAYFPL